MEDKNRFIDQLLDSALAHQRGTEPRAGFEARIVENVRATERQRTERGRFWKPRTAGWVLVAAVIAAAIVVAVVETTYQQHGPTVQTPQASNSVSVQPQSKELAATPKATPKPRRAATVLEAKQTAHKVRKRPRRIEAHHWPAQFPTPAPLTKEEKALVRYVQETPPQVLATPLFKEQASAEPIEIKPVKLKPIEISPVTMGTTNEEFQ